MTLNILLSFAQFEREIIAERTRDKVAAEKSKGRWMGGRPFLGYDLDREKGGLIVNEVEADRVRQIFDVYLKTGSLSKTAKVLNDRGWGLKKWVTRAGRIQGGGRFSKNSVHRLLCNVCYVGKISHVGKVFEGRHEAIVPEEVFGRAQKVLHENCRNGLSGNRDRSDSGLLKGVLYCSHCNTTMIHSTTRKKNNRVYRYYVCGRAMREGWVLCPARSVPAGQVEHFVLEQIKSACDTHEIRQAVSAEFFMSQPVRHAELQEKKGLLQRQQSRLEEQILKVSRSDGRSDSLVFLEDEAIGTAVSS